MPNKSKPLNQINRLYRLGLDLIDREITCLKDLSIGGKLPISASKDLRDYIKLLKEMKDAHETIDAQKRARTKSAVEAIPDEKLKELLRD